MKKIFSAFLLMTAMVFSVSTFVSCNDLTGELEDVKTQTTGMETKIAQLTEQVNALQTALTAAQNDVKAAKEAADNAALAAAQAKADAIKEAKAEVEILKAAYEAKVKDLDAKLAGKVDQSTYDAAMKEATSKLAEVEALLNAKIAAIEPELAKMATKTELEAEVAELVKADNELRTGIAALEKFKEYAQDSLQTIEAAQAEAEAIRAEFKALVEENYTELYGLIGTNAGIIASLVDDVDIIKAAIADLQAADETNQANHQEILKSLQGVIETADNNETAIAEIKEILATQGANIQEITLPLMAALEDIDALKTNIAEYYELISTNTQNLQFVTTALSSVIEDVDLLKGDVAGLKDGMAALQADLTKVQNFFDSLANELIQSIQSLVFIPEYDDLKITGFRYTFDGDPISKNIVIKGKYQVNPAQVAAKLVDEYSVMMCARNVETRAAADAPAVWTKAVVSNVASDGTFDVEAVFTMPEQTGVDAAFTSFADFLANAVVALYVNESEAVAEPAVDSDGMVVETTGDILKNDITSSWVGVHYVGNNDLKDLYRLYNPELEVEYTPQDTTMAWDAKATEFAPLAGYEPRMLIGDEYMTIADAAALMHIDVEAITPEYEDVLTFDNDATLEECDKLTVTPEENVLNRTIAINGAVKAATAADFVGHNVAVEGQFTVNGVTVIDNVDYSYAIGYRTVTLKLAHKDADRVEWTLQNIYDLRDNGDKINSDFDRVFGEYDVETIVNAADEVDYEAIIANDPAPVTTVVLNGVEMTTGAPEITITPKTSILRKIAAVEVTGYEFSADVENAYEFTKTYVDAATCTKVEYEYALTLGQKPEKIEVNFTKVFPFSNLSEQTATFDVPGAVFESEFGQYLVGSAYEDLEAYQPKDDYASHVGNKLYDAEGNALPLKGTSFNLGDGLFTLPYDAMLNVYNNADGQATLVRSLTTWYGVEFIFNVNFSITEPPYTLNVLPYYVKDGVAQFHYQYVSNVYTLTDAYLANYFEVDGLDGKNAVTVKFTIKSDKHNLGAPVFNGTSSTITLAPQADGTFKRTDAVISWGNYPCLTATLEAEIYINGAASGVKQVVTLLGDDPIEYISGKTITKDRNPNVDVTVNVLEGLTVKVIDKAAMSAEIFVNGKTTAPAQRAIAGDYGATIVAAAPKVKFADGRELDPTLYTWDPTTFSFTLKGETLAQQVSIFAEFDTRINYTLNGDVDYTATDCLKRTVVTYEFKY